MGNVNRPAAPAEPTDKRPLTISTPGELTDKRPLTTSTPGLDPIIIPHVEKYRDMCKYILTQTFWTLNLLIVIRHRKSNQILAFYYHRTNVCKPDHGRLNCIDCHRVIPTKDTKWVDPFYLHPVRVPNYDNDLHLKSEIYVLDPKTAYLCKSYRVTQCSCYPNTYEPFITSFIRKAPLGDLPDSSKIKEIISEGLPLAMFEELYRLGNSVKYQDIKKIANVKQCHINVYFRLSASKFFLCNDHVLVININNCVKCCDNQFTYIVNVSNLTKEERQDVMDCFKSKMAANYIASFTADNNIILANVTGLCEEYYPKG